MSILNCRLSLFFSELLIPASKITSCIIDVFYEDKKLRVNYPQTSPLILTLNSPLKKDAQIISFYLLVQRGKKLRKLAKGELNIYKKYFFLSSSLTFEKDVYLFTFRNQLDAVDAKSKKTIFYPGKIRIKGQFFDAESKKEGLEETKEGLEGKDLGELSAILGEMNEILKVAVNSVSLKEKEKLLSSQKQAQSHLSQLKAPKKPSAESPYSVLNFSLLPNSNFDDEDQLKLLLAESQNPRQEIEEDLSDVSISVDSEEEGDMEENSRSVEKVNYRLDEMIAKLRKYFDENGDNLLPQDPDKLRSLLENLTGQVKNISETYSQNLQSMSAINKRLKFQAKDYYDSIISQRF